MTQVFSEALGKVLYSEPSNMLDAGVQHRTVCRLHSNGWSKTYFRRDGMKWTTVNHYEGLQANPLSEIMKGL